MKKELCPAWGKTCSKCQKKNHFASKCFTEAVKQVQDTDTDSNYDSSDDEWVNTLRAVHINEVSSEEEWISTIKAQNADRLKCILIVEDKEVVFEIDTGASCNTISQSYAKNMEHKRKKLNMWNDTTHTSIGVCRSKVKNPKNGKKYSIPFTVVEDSLGLTPLIGLKTATAMKLVQVMEENVE